MTRLQDCGIRIGSYPRGRHNAITDVAGVRVGHSTIIRGDGAREVGKGPVRTGVTIIEPRPGSARAMPCFAGPATLNGNGEMTGLEWVRESGLLATAIGITNTYSVGVVRDALAAHDSSLTENPAYWSMPVVAETFDGTLNDIRGHHVQASHVREALSTARTGPIAEGNVGGGTGMICHEFKGGIGTSSRALAGGDGGWTVGVLVQANYGKRRHLRVAGVPVGELIPESEVPAPGAAVPAGSGSIIIVVATDAPLLPDQCRRVATRASVGLARVGGGTSDSSGDIMLCFATGNEDIPAELYGDGLPDDFAVRSVPHQRLTPLFEATADATEEAILNALLAAEDMTGPAGVTAHALPVDRLISILADCAIVRARAGDDA